MRAANFAMDSLARAKKEAEKTNQLYGLAEVNVSHPPGGKLHDITHMQRLLQHRE